MEILTDNEVWERINAAIAVIGEARGATSFGASTLDAARLALTAMQMAVIYKQDDLIAAPVDGFQTMTVMLPPEAIVELDAFILRSEKRMLAQEAVAFLLGRALKRERMLWAIVQSR